MTKVTSGGTGGCSVLLCPSWDDTVRTSWSVTGSHRGLRPTSFPRTCPVSTVAASSGSERRAEEGGGKGVAAGSQPLAVGSAGRCGPQREGPDLSRRTRRLG